MDLISREALKDYLEINISFGGADKKFKFYDHIDSVPSAFEGMTNGEAIQAMFPNSKTETISFNGIRLYIDDEVHTKIADFTHRWWKAPYKGVRE